MKHAKSRPPKPIHKVGELRRQRGSVAVIVGIVVVVLILIGGGIYGYQYMKQKDKEEEAANQEAARSKLEEMVGQRERAEQMRAQAAQWAEQKAAERAERAEFARTHPPERLARVAKLHVWGPITVPDLNIDAYLKSLWKPDGIHFRLALVGQRDALQRFMHDHGGFYVIIMTVDNAKLLEIPLKPQSMSWASEAANYGQPTLEIESIYPMPIDDYEVGKNWSLQWGD